MEAMVYFLNGSGNGGIATMIIAIGFLFAGGVMLYLTSQKLRQKQKQMNATISQKTKQLEQEVKRLRHENELNEMLSSVALHTQSGVIIADAEGQILWINQGFKNMVGYDLEGLKKQRGDSLITASSSPNIELVINQALRMKQSVRYETYTYNRKGQKIWVSSLITPVFDDHQQLKRFVIIDTDVSELRNLKSEKGEEQPTSIEFKPVNFN